MKLFDFFKSQKTKLPLPKSQTQEILLELILKDEISIFNFPYVPKFSSRISDLRKELTIHTRTGKHVSKYGNPYSYSIHALDEKEVDKAINLYLRLNKF